MSPRLPLALLAGLCSLACVSCDMTDRFQSVPNCQHFFYKDQPPSGFVAISQSHLCQRLNGKVYYATLYDRAGRLPIYSAFIYKHRAQGDSRDKGVDRTWMYEPQLVDRQADGNMTLISTAAKRDPAVLRTQAAGSDYPMRLGQVNYIRGQLNPPNFQRSHASRSATYTVTNAVPYPRRFHHESWKPAMARVVRRLRGECLGSAAYVVSGAMRAARAKEIWAPAKGKGRAAAPELLWMAFCCANGVSGATVGRCSTSGSPAPSVLNLAPYETQDVGVGELEQKLAAYLKGKRVKIFDGGCAPL